MIDLERAKRDPWYILKVVCGHDPDCAVHPAAWGRLADTACIGCLRVTNVLKQDS